MNQISNEGDQNKMNKRSGRGSNLFWYLFFVLGILFISFIKSSIETTIERERAVADYMEKFDQIKEELQNMPIIPGSVLYQSTVAFLDDATGEVRSCHVDYPTLNSSTTREVLLVDNGRNHLLISTSPSNFDIDDSKGLCSVDIRTANGEKTIALETVGDSSKYRKIVGLEETYPICLLIPPGIIPDDGHIQFCLKGKVFSFDLN